MPIDERIVIEARRTRSGDALLTSTSNTDPLEDAPLEEAAFCCLNSRSGSYGRLFCDAGSSEAGGPSADGRAALRLGRLLV